MSVPKESRGPKARHFALSSIILAIAFIACSPSPSPPPQPSPDGTLQLTTRINPDKSNPTRCLCVIVEIREATGKLLFQEITPAASNKRWSIQWLNNNDILLQSSDIGDYHIRKQPNGSWQGKL